MYFADSETLQAPGPSERPASRLELGSREGRESAAKLAALDPKLVLAGHTEPHAEPNLKEQLERAAEAG